MRVPLNLQETMLNDVASKRCNNSFSRSTVPLDLSSVTDIRFILCIVVSGICKRAD